jgi:broad specificity phosphatase PhoE
LLTDGDVGVVDALCELRRGAAWVDDFQATVVRAFAEPAVAAYDGWEPLEECRARVTKAVSGILSAHAGEDVVLVGHGTAWTVLASELTGTPPDLARWRDLGLPDVITVDVR